MLTAFFFLLFDQQTGSEVQGQMSRILTFPQETKDWTIIMEGYLASGWATFKLVASEIKLQAHDKGPVAFI